MANMPFTYERIIDNFNMQDTLTLDGTVYAFCIKKTELTNLRIMKDESVYLATQEGFCGGQKGQRKAEACIIAWSPNRGYAIQDYSLHLAINYFYYKKNGHG